MLVEIARQQRAQRLADAELTDEEYKADLLQRCGQDPEHLTAQMIAQSAADGNEIAREVLGHACQTLGWAIAQMITLLAPEIVVLGGGVSLIGEQWFFSPVRDEVQRYVFPPLLGSYRIVPARLGELVVVHGAIALATGAG
jgi:glucokinase